MEECYQAEDYIKMNDMLAKIGNSYKSVYDKYNKIGSLYRTVHDYQESAVQYARAIKEGKLQPHVLEFTMDRLFEVLKECQDLEDNGFVYDEEAQVASFSNTAESVLKDVLLLTDDEIRSGMDLQKADKPDYTKLCEISAERMRGGSR